MGWHSDLPVIDYLKKRVKYYSRNLSKRKVTQMKKQHDPKLIDRWVKHRHNRIAEYLDAIKRIEDSDHP